MTTRRRTAEGDLAALERLNRKLARRETTTDNDLDPWDEDDRKPCGCASRKHMNGFALASDDGSCRRVTRHPSGLCRDCRPFVA